MATLPGQWLEEPEAGHAGICVLSSLFLNT